jgi:hypothetical protein
MRRLNSFLLTRRRRGTASPPSGTQMLGRGLLIGVCILLILPEGSAGASEFEERAVSNCIGGGQVVLRVFQPGVGVATANPTVRIRLLGDCDGVSVPFMLGVDGKGYQLSNNVLVEGGSDPACSPELRCWPQFGVSAQEPDWAYPLDVSPGSHVLEVVPGMRGTDLPSFNGIEIHFTRSTTGSLPRTGYPSETIWVVIGACLIVLGWGFLLVSNCLSWFNRRTS